MIYDEHVVKYDQAIAPQIEWVLMNTQKKYEMRTFLLTILEIRTIRALG